MKMKIIADRHGKIVATGGAAGAGDGAPSEGGPLASTDRYVAEVDLPDDFAEQGIDRLHHRFQLRFGDNPGLVDLEKAGTADPKDPKQGGVYPVRLIPGKSS